MPPVSSPPDRRGARRAQLEIFLNEYVDDRVFRRVTSNVSEEGLYFEGTPVRRRREAPVQLEIELPGTESIWAKGEITHQIYDDYHHGAGVRLVGLPRLHAIALRDYVAEKRDGQVRAILEHVRKNRDH